MKKISNSKTLDSKIADSNDLDSAVNSAPIIPIKLAAPKEERKEKVFSGTGFASDAFW